MGSSGTHAQNNGRTRRFLRSAGRESRLISAQRCFTANEKPSQKTVVREGSQEVKRTRHQPPRRDSGGHGLSARLGRLLSHSQISCNATPAGHPAQSPRIGVREDGTYRAP